MERNHKILIAAVATSVVGTVIVKSALALHKFDADAAGREWWNQFPDEERWWREPFLKKVDWHLRNRTRYEWGGGHFRPSTGVDCSGLVIDSARELFTVPYNSDGMYRNLPSINPPRAGDLALYGSPEKAIHVRVVTSWDAEKKTASGIESTVTAQQNGVQRWSNHRIGPGSFLGFRTLSRLAENSRRMRSAGISPVYDIDTPPG